jgi:hypothetical protein
VSKDTSASDYIYFLSNTALFTNTWYHICATFTSGQGAAIYINGALDASIVTTQTTTANSSNDLGIGARTVGSRRFMSGKLDEVRVYNRALSPQEIAALVNSRRRNHSQ